MKTNKILFPAALLLTIIAIFAFWQHRTTARFGRPPVELAAGTNRPAYALGEVIEVTFEISNPTGETVELAPPGVGTGNLRLYISTDGANYREYRGPKWGNSDARPRKVRLAAGEKLSAAATVLYNRTTATAHLTEMYADRINREFLDTDLAVQQAGAYYLKAVYADGPTRAESAPQFVEIFEPAGTDAKLWEKIKTDRAYAYFLQTGEVAYFPGTPEREKFVEGLRRIPDEFPGSSIAERIGVNLARFDRMTEALAAENRSKPE